MEEKELFDLVEYKGECIEGKLHIIDISDYSYDEDLFYDLKKYRVYHGDGYCFNIEKYSIDDEYEFNEKYGEESNIKGFYYYFISDLFDGYKTLSLKNAIELIKKYR